MSLYNPSSKIRYVIVDRSELRHRYVSTVRWDPHEETWGESTDLAEAYFFDIFFAGLVCDHINKKAQAASILSGRPADIYVIQEIVMRLGRDVD